MEILKLLQKMKEADQPRKDSEANKTPRKSNLTDKQKL